MARAEGIGTVSMRRIAEKLGSAPMSLYRHLTNREEGLLGMLGVVMLGVVAASPGRASPQNMSLTRCSIAD